MRPFSRERGFVDRRGRSRVAIFMVLSAPNGPTVGVPQDRHRRRFYFAGALATACLALLGVSLLAAAEGPFFGEQIP